MMTNQVNAASFNTSAVFNDDRVLHNCECVQLCAEVAALKNIVLKLEKDFKDSVESNLNRELYFRDAVDFKFDKMEESIKDAVLTLEREVIDCFKRRDKKWAKQLEQSKDPETAISPPIATTNPVPPTSTPGFPPTNDPTASTTSRTVNRATDGEFCATVTTRPDLDTNFSILPFYREQLTSAQSDDDTLQRLSISPSTPPTDGIEVRDHQGVLYRQIQKGGGNIKIQLVVHKALIQQTIQHFHLKTPERHHGWLKTLLRILEVAWWPTIRSDVWRFFCDCKSCGVETNPNSKPIRHQHHHCSSASTSPSTKETHKLDRRKCRGSGVPGRLDASGPWEEWRHRPKDIQAGI
ncbi:uncharacterized protein LOC125245846 [Megalobrama amblycephala]|uniref:uncharacterized protein LOC125245846 n=1 Tax=Megalobrama amblycephala TaxID=75352 RepID=UPI00201457B6|nr:uncharacterized protein LOC125245846 [Megalobrama amblycephala]